MMELIYTVVLFSVGTRCNYVIANDYMNKWSNFILFPKCKPQLIASIYKKNCKSVNNPTGITLVENHEILILAGGMLASLNSAFGN